VPHSLELHKINWDLDIYCDSAYVVNGANNWVFGWANSGWKTAEGKPVANVEFWRLILKLLHKTKPRISWVKGHKGVYGNELADELATDAMKKMKGPKVYGSYATAITEIWKAIT
jgi:ribonuclease HI